MSSKDVAQKTPTAAINKTFWKHELQVRVNLKTIMKQQHGFAGKGTNRVGAVGGLRRAIPMTKFQPPRKKQKQRLGIDISNWLSRA
jgi:hypothetical protein